MTDRVDYLLHAPDRATFVAVMAALAHPLDGRPLASLDPDTGALVPHRDIRIDEVGPIVKGHVDGSGAWVQDAVVAGHHANVLAIGPLAAALTAGLPETGSLFERTRILDFLGAMAWEEISAEGVPPGYQGASGVRIFDPAVVGTPQRVWA